MSLSPAEIAQIAEQTVEQLVDRKRLQWIEPELHAQDHEWVARQRQRESEFAALRRKVITSACIWAVPIVMGFVVSSLWRELLRLIRG